MSADVLEFAWIQSNPTEPDNYLLSTLKLPLSPHMMPWWKQHIFSVKTVPFVSWKPFEIKWEYLDIEIILQVLQCIMLQIFC